MYKLIVESLSFNIAGQTLLNNIFLECNSGEVIGILGRNGAGKSSLLKIIFGVLKPDYSSIRLNNNVLFKGFKQGMIRYLSQQPMLPGFLTIKGCLDLFGIDKQQFDSYFNDENVGLSGKISGISHGQRKIFELFLIFKSHSMFVLLDEPFTSLSPLQVEKIQSLIVEEKKHKGIIITDHRYQDVLGVSDKYYLLENAGLHPILDFTDPAAYNFLPDK